MVRIPFCSSCSKKDIFPFRVIVVIYYWPWPFLKLWEEIGATFFTSSFRLVTFIPLSESSWIESSDQVFCEKEYH